LALAETAMHRVRMSIKPAFGWLALVLFATTAQAEGTRDLLKLGAGAAKPAAVIRKTKAVPSEPPALVRTSTGTVTPSLVVVETSGKPRVDYEAEGAVTMIFERQRRSAFKISRDHIRREVRLEASDARRNSRRDHVDVIDADEGVIVVDSAMHANGVASDIYVFDRAASLEQRVGVLTREPGAPARVREALVAAEWAKVPAADH
jgi:hypothetical protein